MVTMVRFSFGEGEELNTFLQYAVFWLLMCRNVKFIRPDSDMLSQINFDLNATAIFYRRDIIQVFHWLSLPGSQFLTSEVPVLETASLGKDRFYWFISVYSDLCPVIGSVILWAQGDLYPSWKQPDFKWQMICFAQRGETTLTG